jgi:hypothetical protein
MMDQEKYLNMTARELAEYNAQQSALGHSARASSDQSSGMSRSDSVICPGCAHQFQAICVDDQKERERLKSERDAARAQALADRAYQTTNSQLREHIRTLREALTLILALDDDAHPGLFTWQDARMKAGIRARAALKETE